MLAGTTGPRSLWLSGELTDGTILTAGTPPDEVRQARRLVDQGRAAAGRTGPHPMVVYVLAATGPGGAERLEAERRRQGDEAIPGSQVAGDTRVAAEAVQRWAEAGADTVVLQPTVDDPDPEGLLRFVAGQVAPLVR